MRTVHISIIIPLILLFGLSATAQAPEEGDIACSSNSGNSALVIIDMQPFFANRVGQRNDPENESKIEKVISTQIETINKAKEANIPIVFIEYDCSVCGSTDRRLRSTVADYKNARFFKKDTDGMLETSNKYRKELVDFLNKNAIGKLIITGANGGACVRQSISGALENNCSVVALNSAIVDFNYKQFIYPYVGQYSDIVTNCKDCTFKEVGSVEKAAESMVNYSGRSPGNQNSSKNVVGKR